MGKIELDHTGSGSGVTLSSDGTDLLLDGTAIGGGGGSSYNLIVENYTNGTSPTVTGTDSVAIGDSCVASGHDSFAAGYYATAAGSQSVALGFSSNVTSGATGGAIALGYQAKVDAGSRGVAIGKSYVNKSDALAAVITNNTSSYGATGASSIALGYQAKASQSYAFATGYQAVASDNSAIAMGFSADATGSSSVAIGYGTAASALNSVALGRNGSVAGNYAVGLGSSPTITSSGSTSIALQGTYINASHSLGFGSESRVDSGHERSMVLGRGAKSRAKGGVHFGGYNAQYAGQNQAGIYILLSDTTDATAEAMTTNNSTASTDNQVMLNNNTVYSFHGTVVARQDATDGSACAAWEVKGLIRREGSASTTTLVNSAITVIDNTPSWGLALSADTTNGCLKVQATGAASTNVKFLATIYTTELTYN